jgi:small subunit ribosomal protein S17
MTRPKSSRRRIKGRVVGDKGDKTITVQVVRRFAHPKYGKMVNRKIRLHAHDETNGAHIGDTVEIVECRPMSRMKRFRLLRVVERNPESATPAAAPQAPAAE